jgi:hypothetical protein
MHVDKLHFEATTRKQSGEVGEFGALIKRSFTMGSIERAKLKAKSPFYEALEHDDITLSMHSSIKDVPYSKCEVQCLLTGDEERMHYHGLHKRIGFSDTKATSNLSRPIEYCSFDQELGFYKRLGRGWYECLYPAQVPRACQLLRLENVAVPTCYLFVGFMQGLAGPFMNVYPLDLNATEAQQTTILGLRLLPASMKLLFGFMCDNFPLMGYRRKSYMMIGWVIASLSMMGLVLFSDLTVTKSEETIVISSEESVTFVRTHVSEGAPSVGFLSLALLLFGVGFWCADVMADTLVAEKAKLEPESTRGHLQSTCYACRFFGVMVAAPFSTFAYGYWGPQLVAQIMAILPLCILPLVYYLFEPYKMVVKNMRDQCSEIWRTICSRAVWQPMAFVYIYQSMQIGNAAWREYLRSVLGFTATQLNSLLVAAYIMVYVGVVAYKCFFLKASWRTVYIVCTSMNAFFSIGQVLLILGITFGVSPFLFALGDDALSDVIAGIQFLPTTIMMVQLCPSGSEGASYAMFTSVTNSAMTMASSLSTQLLWIWDVSKDTMMAGNLYGMIKLTILTTLLQTSGVIFVGLLPRYNEDLAVLHADRGSESRVGGFIFLAVTLSSMTYSWVISVHNILCPR